MSRLGQYIPALSPIHRLDPRVKIAGVILLSVLTLAGGIPGALLLSGFFGACLWSSGLGARCLWNVARPARTILLLLFALHLCFTAGRPIPPFPGGYPSPTWEGLYRGGLVAWQFALLLCGGALLTMTTAPAALVHGLEKLLKPLARLGLPVPEVALLLSLALRFVPTLLEEIQRTREAMACRGADFENAPLRRRLGWLLSLLTPVTLSAFRRAEELADAMEARGYCRGPRTYAQELRLSPSDLIAAALVSLVAAGAFCLQLYSG